MFRTRLRQAAALALLSATAMLGCEGRPRPTDATSEPPPKKSGPAVAVIDLSGGLPEQEKATLFGPAGGKRSFDDILRVTNDLRDDKRSPAVMVKLGSAAIGAARAQELAELLAGIKAKKKVYCHADGLTNTSLMVAAKGCSSIWLSPAGEVDAIGIAAQLVYMRRLLVDELHLDVDFLQVGKYKGAEEPVTRDGPSPEARASLMSVLTDMRASWVETLAAERSGHANAEVIEDGPWSPGRAKELGLIDEIGYLDEALAAAKKETGAGRERVVFGSGAEDDDGGMDEIVRAIAGEGGENGPIALVRATGSISMTAGGNGILGGRGGIIEKDFNRTIAKLAQDDDVKAVVLRIDSPGGSALASDLMWHQLIKLRKKKPLVISVGDMAASGGYYLACTGDYIFAEPMSIVGSIGVVGGKIGVGDALERVGVHVETFPASSKPGAAARAASESPLVKWDEPTKHRVLESMNGVYELFLARIVEGRSTRGRTVTREKVAENAEGRIFSGRDGKARGLVDEIGGLGAAIAKARELAKLSATARVATIAGKGGLFETLDPSSAEEKVRARTTSPIAVLDRTAPDVVPFVTSLAPLAEGERMALAMPFALTVR